MQPSRSTPRRRPTRPLTSTPVKARTLVVARATARAATKAAPARTPAKAKAAVLRKSTSTPATARTPARARARMARTPARVRVPAPFRPPRLLRSPSSVCCRLPVPAPGNLATGDRHLKNMTTEFPYLGIGVGLRTVHFSHILSQEPEIDWFE